MVKGEVGETERVPLRTSGLGKKIQLKLDMYNKFNSFLDRFSARVTLWVAFGGTTLVGSLTAYLASVSNWINSFGYFAWVLAGLTAGVLALGIILMFFAIRFQITRSSAILLWQERSDTINPLDTEFFKKRISLAGLADPIDKSINGKTFTDCDLLGPCNLYIYHDVSFIKLGFVNCDIVALTTNPKPNFRIANCIGITNSQITGGRIANMTIFVAPNIVPMFLEMGMIPITDYVTLSPENNEKQ